MFTKAEKLKTQFVHRLSDEHHEASGKDTNRVAIHRSWKKGKLICIFRRFVYSSQGSEIVAYDFHVAMCVMRSQNGIYPCPEWEHIEGFKKNGRR